jgi:hypothetical protein
MKEEKKLYKFKLPIRLYETISKLGDFQELHLKDGTLIKKDYYDLHDEIVEHDEFMEYLRHGYPEEYFQEFIPEDRTFQLKIKIFETLVNLVAKNTITEDNETIGFIFRDISSPNTMYQVFIYNKKDKCWSIYNNSNLVKSGLGFKKKNQLYNFFLNKESYKNILMNSVILGTLDKYNISQSLKNIEFFKLSENQKLFGSMYKFYSKPKLPLHLTTGSGAGQLSTWLTKKEAKERFSTQLYRTIDKTQCIKPKALIQGTLKTFNISEELLKKLDEKNIKVLEKKLKKIKENKESKGIKNGK